MVTQILLINLCFMSINLLMSPIYVTYALRKKLSTLVTNLEPFQPSIVFHIETSHLICGAIYKMQHQANIG